MKLKKGFTLVELLVVIAVIGILSAVVVLNTNSAKSKARDAIRLSDMATLKTSLGLYLEANGKYPDQRPSPDPSTTCLTNCVISRSDTAMDGNPGKYISDMDTYFPGGLPNDPINKSNGSGNYFYSYQAIVVVSAVSPPCDVSKYSRRILLGVRTFESIPAYTRHPKSPIQEAQAECWPSANDSTWVTNGSNMLREWGYTVLEEK
ncbi:MAG: prepilin-type N-terminal cleavage/methylation domain-containing protein [Candidatus Berkelbacteria bacterium]